MTLERLISDGRIHPARIEEMVEKCRHEVEAADQAGGRARRDGDSASTACTPNSSSCSAACSYRTSYGQNVLTHSHGGGASWPASWQASWACNVTLAKPRRPAA